MELSSQAKFKPDSLQLGSITCTCTMCAILNESLNYVKDMSLDNQKVSMNSDSVKGGTSKTLLCTMKAIRSSLVGNKRGSVAEVNIIQKGTDDKLELSLKSCLIVRVLWLLPTVLCRCHLLCQLASIFHTQYHILC